MFRLFSQWTDRAVRAYQRRQAVRELSRFSDRELADLGIERGMIPSLVAGLQARLPEREDRRERPVTLSLQGCG
jgi:uncharacterized protein YjiS (DUF1127 family)